MMLRKGLFLILALALLSVPVLQTAHALTHFTHAETASTTSADSAQDESGADADIDRVCLDCLALTACGAILPLLVFFFVARILRQPLPSLKRSPFLRNFSSPYLTRAPPLA